MSDRAAEIVSGISELPPVPHVAIRMNQLLHDRRATARDVGQLLASDPSIASNVLSLANSSFYGATQRVGTLTHAVLVLGFNTVRNVVSASSLIRALSSKQDPEEQVQFWRHSLACGTLAKLIAIRNGHADPEELFLQGLLHDVGEIVLRGWCTETMTQVDAMILEGSPRWEAELELLGTTHAHVGGALMELWRLPPSHVDVVRNHHTPGLARESEQQAAIIHVADALVHSLDLGVSPGEMAPHLNESAWAMVGLGLGVLPEVFRETFAGVRRVECFLEPVRRA